MVILKGATMKKIVILLASVVKNKALAQKFEQISKEQQCEVEIINLVELELPLYTSITEEKHGIPEEAKRLRDTLFDYQAFLVISPEYNGSMPPVLTNAIAWVSRVDKDFRTVFNQKFVALATHSGGGGNKGNDAMRSMFAYLGANVLSRELICTYKKPCEEKTIIAIIEELKKYA